MKPKRKILLFTKSKHFCAVPWNHIKVDPSGKITTCVKGSELLGNIHHNSIEEILSNKNLLRIKNNLKQDLHDVNCQSCQSLENNEEHSYKFLRDLYNPLFKHSLVDYDSDTEFILNGIDLHWGSTCNLKCITCWAEQSSSIAKEIGVPVKQVTSDAADNLINFIVSNQHSLKEIYMSGGEPTLIKHNLQLLKGLRRDLDFTLRVNTNLSFPENNAIINELKNFPKVQFTISADAMGDRFNYIRRGADWKNFLYNLDRLRNLHFSWTVNSVFFVASAISLPETQKFFMENWDIHDFTINQVGMGHTNLKCRNLPVVTKKIVETKILEHREKYKNNLNLYGQLTNCIKEIRLDVEECYTSFFEGTDKKIGSNWRN